VKSKYYYAGYPIEILDKICSVKWARTPPKGYKQKAFTAFLPYLGAVSDVLEPFLNQYNVRTVSKRSTTIKDMFTKASKKPTRPLPSNYVYALPCASCNKYYIGQTKRGLQRLQDHERDLKNKKTSSALVQHMNKTQHEPDFTHFTPLMQDQFYFSRLNLETYFIYLLQPDTINLQIPQHYGIKEWMNFISKHLPKQNEAIKAYVSKKLTSRKYTLPNT